MQSALQEEIDTLRSQYRSERDPAGLTFASLADAYRRAGELDEAWTLLEEGLDEHPDFTTGHLVAARVLRDRGEPESAAERYGRVLDLDPENSSALREKAALAQDAGRIEEALALCQRLALLEPADADLRSRIRSLKETHFGSAGEDEGVPQPDDTESLRDVEAFQEAEAAEEIEEVVEAEPVEEMEEVEAVEELALEGEAADEVDLGNVWAEEPDEMDQEPDWAEEPEEPALPERGAEPPVFTRTMADLYARQGHVGRALKIYHRLLDRHPDDEALRDRIRELEEEATASAETGRTISSYFESLIGWESET